MQSFTSVHVIKLLFGSYRFLVLHTHVHSQLVTTELKPYCWLIKMQICAGAQSLCWFCLCFLLHTWRGGVSFVCFVCLLFSLSFINLRVSALGNDCIPESSSSVFEVSSCKIKTQLNCKRCVPWAAPTGRGDDEHSQLFGSVDWGGCRLMHGADRWNAWLCHIQMEKSAHARTAEKVSNMTRQKKYQTVASTF